MRSDRGLLGPLHVLVTGASSGIGAAIARAYAGRGARVALFARRRQALDAVAAACRVAGAADAVVIAGDVTRRADIAAAFDVLDRRWARIDRAVLNAGTAIRDEAARSFVECCTSDAQTAIGFDADVAESILRTNLLGVIYFLDPVLTRMRAAGAGRIAVTGSMAADGLLHRSGPYMASKVAIRALIEGLRLDACNLNIGLTLLEPGFVSTEMTDGIPYRMPFLLTADRAAETFVRGIEAGHDRVRTPWQMAAINYLAGYVPRPLRNRAAMWLAERT